MSDLVYMAYQEKMKEKELYRLERRVSSFRTAVFRYRKTAAKEESSILFSVSRDRKEKSIMSLNDSAKKQQERNKQ